MYGNETVDSYYNGVDQNDPKQKAYLDKKITLEVKKEFDVRYPLDVKKFSFYQGGKELSFKDFMALSKDKELTGMEKKIDKIKKTGFGIAAVSGGVTVAFLIPAIAFTILQTNHNMIDPVYNFSGAGMYILSMTSLVVLFVDLIVTFSMLHKYQFNEFAVRQAVQRYNKKVRESLGIVPDLSFNNEKFNISCRILI